MYITGTLVCLLLACYTKHNYVANIEISIELNGPYMVENLSINSSYRIVANSMQGSVYLPAIQYLKS